MYEAPGLVPGDTALRSDGHTPGHQSLLVQLPRTGPVILAGDSCYWQLSIDEETPPGVVWDPTRAMRSIQRLKTLGRLPGRRTSPAPPPRSRGRPGQPASPRRARGRAMGRWAAHPGWRRAG